MSSTPDSFLHRIEQGAEAGMAQYSAWKLAAPFLVGLLTGTSLGIVLHIIWQVL
jgi:hypothetical protein